jgi:hypothetical protein
MNWRKPSWPWMDNSAKLANIRWGFVVVRVIAKTPRTSHVAFPGVQSSEIKDFNIGRLGMPQ